MSKSKALPPQRGEVWLVNLDPTVGKEIKKTRPAVVVSSDAIGVLPIKVVAPVTEWDNRYANHIWHVRINANVTNGLRKDSSIDTLQIRGIDQVRFTRKMGRISPTQLEEIAAAIAAVIEYQ